MVNCHKLVVKTPNRMHYKSQINPGHGTGNSVAALRDVCVLLVVLCCDLGASLIWLPGSSELSDSCVIQSPKLVCALLYNLSIPTTLVTYESGKQVKFVTFIVNNN